MIISLIIIAVALAFVVWLLWEMKNAPVDPNDREKTDAEIIRGECGGPDCVTGCDKPFDAEEAANKASDKLDKDFCKAIGIEQPISASFIKPEKEHYVTEDEIRHTAYLLAAADNFAKRPEIYWIEAEKQLKGTK
jgi:hypothetical protein